MLDAREAIKEIWQCWGRQIWFGLATGLGLFIWLFPKAFTNPSETREVVLAVVAGAFAIYLGARTASRLWPDRGIFAAERWLGKFLGRRPKPSGPPEAPKAGPRRTAFTALPLANVDLREAALPGADLVATDLRGATLRGADLTGAALRRADLRDADLSRSDLRFAGLSQTDLTGANLSEARLDGANLAGTDLRDADLRDASLQGVLYDNATLWPLHFGEEPPAGAENVDQLDR